MTIAAQQVVDRVVALLAAVPPFGGRVWSDRAHPVDTYPAARIVAGVEQLKAADADDDITWPRTQLHELALDVQIHAQATTGLDAALRALVLQVLLALEGTRDAATLQPLPGCTLQATSVRLVPPAAEGQAATGMAVVGIEILFHTRANAPETLI